MSKGQRFNYRSCTCRDTSKGAEGYAARILFKEAKNLGITVEIYIGKTMTSKAIQEIYPEAEIMICRGHERSHLNQVLKCMEKLSFLASEIGHVGALSTATYYSGVKVTSTAVPHVFINCIVVKIIVLAFSVNVTKLNL